MKHENKMIILTKLNKLSGWKTRTEIIYGGICNSNELMELIDDGFVSVENGSNNVNYYNVSRRGQEELIKTSVDNLFKDLEL